MTKICDSCKAPWNPNDQGACPHCGGRIAQITLVVSDAVHTIDSHLVKIIPQANFDLTVPHDGKTIIDVSKFIDQELIKYFHENPTELKTMNRRLLEEMVAELFHGFGYDVELTKKTRDGGKDIIAIKRAEANVKYLIECKRPDPGGYVSIGPVRELYGVKSSERATKAIMVTTAYFSPDAHQFFDKHKWELEGKEYEDLRLWLVDYLQRIGSF